MENVMGKRIKELRLKKGITQEELGKIIGVQKSAILKYESGMVENMKRSSIKTLAEFFGVKPSYLMGLDNNIINVYSSVHAGILSDMKILLETQLELIKLAPKMVKLRRQRMRK